MSQPQNDKVYSLATNDWFMCVIKGINDPSKEVKVRFMWKPWQCFLLSKNLEKWFPKSAIFHRSICPIPSTDNRMRYSFDEINIKGICDKIKNTLDRDFKMNLHICNRSSNEYNKQGSC